MLKVLVVDDQPLIRSALKSLLGLEKDMEVIAEAADGLEASRIAADLEPDVILMDINMPLINGFDTTRKIREKGIQIPVIALTAFDKQEVSEEAIAAGMNDILIKPFEPTKLYQIISNQIIKKENAD